MTALGQGAAIGAFASGDEEENKEETVPHPESAARPTTISATRAGITRRRRRGRLEPAPNADNRRSDRFVRAVADGLAAGRLASAQPNRTRLLRDPPAPGPAPLLILTAAH